MNGGVVARALVALGLVLSWSPLSVAEEASEDLVGRAPYVEGEVIAGSDAKMIADMPDKQTVRGQLAGLLSAPARGLAVSLSGLGSGLARCLQQRADGEGGGDA